MQLAHTSEVQEIIALNLNRNLVIGEKYRVLRDGGIEDGWLFLTFTPHGKLLLLKTI